MNGFIGLLKIELPSRDVLLCDGGFITYAGDDYTAKDSVLGTIAGIEALSEGASDEIPALDITFNPPEPLAFTELTSGALQRSAVRLWLAEYDIDTNAIVGTPDLLFLGQLDQPAIRFSRTEYTVAISCVPQAEWLFEQDTGNALSSTFQKQLYPGDLGHDNGTGLQVPVAWGVASPQSGGSATGFGSSIIGGAGGNVQPRNVVAR